MFQDICDTYKQIWQIDSKRLYVREVYVNGENDVLMNIVWKPKDEMYRVLLSARKKDALLKFAARHAGYDWDRMDDDWTPEDGSLEKMLSEADPNYKESADIKWNFTKFLVNKKGQVVARFEPTENIANIAAQIEELLKL